MPKAFRDLRVVVVGDAILDTYTIGKVKRVSPEAPVPVLDVQEQYHSLGGASNVWMNLRNLGVKVDLVSAIGTDEAASIFSSLFADADGSSNYITYIKDAVTTEKRRFIDDTSGYHLLRADIEDAFGYYDCQFDVMDRLQEALIGDIDALVISDYCKGLFDAGLRGGAIHAARQKGCVIVVDTKTPRWEEFSGAHWLTPNLAEVEAAIGAPLSGENNIRSIAQFVKAKGIGGLLVTMSAQGLAVCHNEAVERLPATASAVKDVTGAGDVVTAVFAAHLAAGCDPHTAAAAANIEAGETVATEGPCLVGERAKHRVVG